MSMLHKSLACALVTLALCSSILAQPAVREPKKTDRDAIDPSYTQHAVVNWDGDTLPDLAQILVWGGGIGPKERPKVQIHVLSGSSNYQKYLVQTTTDRDAADPKNVSRDYVLYDWDQDGKLDLVEILKWGGGIGPKVQIHVLSGSSNYQKYLVQTITDRDAGPPNQIETVHFIADWDLDGKPDLVELLKFGGGVGKKTQIHILSGASNFKKYLLQTVTDRDVGRPNSIVADHAFVDWDKDGKPDLVEILKFGGGIEDKMSLHILSGATNFQKYIVQMVLPFDAVRDAKSAREYEFCVMIDRIKVKEERWETRAYWSTRVDTDGRIYFDLTVERIQLPADFTDVFFLAAIRKTNTKSRKIEIMSIDGFERPQK